MHSLLIWRKGGVTSFRKIAARKYERGNARREILSESRFSLHKVIQYQNREEFISLSDRESILGDFPSLKVFCATFFEKSGNSINNYLTPNDNLDKSRLLC